MIRCVKYSINAEKLHAVFICYELCQKSRQAVADIENAMKIIIAEQASCPIPQAVSQDACSAFCFPEFPRIERRFLMLDLSACPGRFFHP